MFKIAVFGITGRTGVPFSEFAVEEGFQIKGLARVPDKYPLNNDSVELIQGDIGNPDDVSKVIEGTDAVVNVIGHTKTSADDIQSIAIQNIINSMGKYRVKRLISLTGGSVRDENDTPQTADKIIQWALRKFQPVIYEDALKHVNIIKEHGELDWTIVRAPRLTQDKFTGNYHVGYVGDTNSTTKISRKDIAHFIVQELKRNKYIHRMPFVSNSKNGE